MMPSIVTKVLTVTFVSVVSIGIAVFFAYWAFLYLLGYVLEGIKAMTVKAIIRLMIIEGASSFLIVFATCSAMWYFTGLDG
jgi:hypothetical protein